MRPLLLGGDQMTVKLIRSAHAALANGNTADDRLEGLVGMVEDFHEKITFLQVNILSICYFTNSQMGLVSLSSSSSSSS